MAVTTRPETVEQEAPGRRPRWIGWTVVALAVAVLIGVATVVWTGSTAEPAGITFSDVQAREAGTPTPANELERVQQMPDGELRDHLLRRALIPTAAVGTNPESAGITFSDVQAREAGTPSPATELERYQQIADDELRDHLIQRSLNQSAAVPTELERYQQMSDDELRQHLVDRGLIPTAAVSTELERFQQMSDDELRQHLVDRGLIPTAAVSAP